MRLQNNLPMIVTHRGWHDETQRPENSLAAARFSRQNGFQWSECDVWLSSDGHVVVLHDEKLDRTTEGRGPVWKQPWRVLRNLRLRNAAGQLTECTLPGLRTLKDASGTSLLVEIKPKNARELVRRVIALMNEGSPDWMLQSFDPQNLRYARDYDPACRVACLVDKPETLAAAVEARWPAVHMQHRMLDQVTSERLSGRGIAAGVWTVNEDEDIDRVLPLSPYMIITDRPDRVARRLPA